MSNSIFRKDGTAQGVAKQRYIETIADPDKRVIDDPYSSIFTRTRTHQIHGAWIKSLAYK